jgi:NAD(P)H-dependent FMN reductase
MVFSGRPTSVGTTQPGGSQGPSSLDLAMSESAKPKGAGGSAKGAKHSSMAVAEWRTLLTEFFASPWSGQQAESFVSAKNRERKAAT